MRTGFAFLIVLILLTTIPLSVVCIQPVKAQTPSAITINADGTLTPAAAPIKQIGNIYSLTRDFVGSITVNRSNIIVDGKNYSVSGGLLIREVSNVTVKGFVITDGKNFVTNEVDGVLLDHATQVTVTNNTISGIWSIWIMNGVGFRAIDVYGGSSNVITGNSLLNNQYGIYFSITQENLVAENTFISSVIIFWNSSNNTVYHNNFITSNGFLAYNGDYRNPNFWDNGYPDGGNYWSDNNNRYPNANEIDSSGISDSPYVLDSNNTDRYPLLEPFNATFNEIVTAPPRITITSPLYQKYNESQVPLVFIVDKAVNWIGYSLDNQANVTIVGNFSIVNLTYGSHNVTVYANSTFGILGTSENVSFTITEPFPTMTVVAVSGVVAVFVVAGLLVYIKKHCRAA